VPEAPFLLAQLSDPHVGAGEPERGGPAEALAAAVGAVGALDPAPGAVLVSGDLVTHGTPAEYEQVRELLAPLSMPVHVIAGNHDAGDALRHAFDIPGGAGADVRYATRCGPLRLIVVDTTIPGREAGAFGEERRTWLASQLAAEPDAPTVVAMHHPPLLTGMRAFDAIGLPEADRLDLARLLARHPQVVRIACGHLHRTVMGGLAGCEVFVCPSTWVQARLDLSDPGHLELLREPPGFAVHLLLGGELTSHVQPVGDFGPPVPLA
jgi:Icc protein